MIVRGRTVWQADEVRLYLDYSCGCSRSVTLFEDCDFQVTAADIVSSKFAANCRSRCSWKEWFLVARRRTFCDHRFLNRWSTDRELKNIRGLDWD